jgi:lipid II:glycine glycyltransferase (peptidoglycan interpeptide bridge formation enzyme)
VSRFRAATPADEAAWQALLGRCGAGDFLHDWAWAAVAAFDGQPQRRFVLEDDGEVVALVAAQERRLPLGRAFWYVPHGPVLDYADARAGEWLRAVTVGLREVGRASRVIAAKLEPRIEVDSPATALFARLRADPRPVQVGQTRVVELADDEALMAGFDKDTRYAVRRSQREGVEVRVLTDASDTTGIDALHGLVLETQRRAGFPRPPQERYRIAWHGLAGAGRASILEACRGEELLASGMLVIEGDRSFYLFSGSRREAVGEAKHYASYLLQWEMMRRARELGSRLHDLWGIAPASAGPEHAWHGVGLFKKGFGGREVRWAGTWDVVIDPTLYRLRSAIAMARSAIPGRSR